MHKQIKKIFLFTGLLVACISVMPGCMKYEAKPFTKSLGVNIKKNDVAVSAHQLNSTECSYYFGQDLSSAGYQVIHLAIKNHSNDPYVLDAHWIDLHLASLRSVCQKMYMNTPLQVSPWLMSALVLWWPLLFVAGAVGYQCTAVNQEITNDVEARAFGSNSIELIKPKHQVNKFLFVSRENWRHNFSLILTNKRTNERATFDMSI